MSKINAHFDSMVNARKAMAALKEMGENNVYVDLAGTFDYEYSMELSASGTPQAAILSALVLTSGGRIADDQKPPLGTAISGMGCVEDCRDVSARLSVRSDGRDPEKISKVITDNGGRIFKSFME